ncbi:DUF3473 domain-containing protein [candidate division GN15 bacterium]|nr:DUF3473 domain-containing protein [candidate division GN15 bacterium]
MQAQRNLLTVDLEEWFVVEILRERYPQETWQTLPSTLAVNVRRLLSLFHEKQVKATWFILGWCAEHHPVIIEEIAALGHEIACHSYWHRRVDQMTPETFREDTQRAVDAIYNATGVMPRGYRAPSWSINNRVAWAFDVLAELGFEYDSSIFPIKHDLYGMPSGPRELFSMQCTNGRELYEFPNSTYRLMGRNVPVSGGGYLRHSPYWYSRQMIRKLNDDGRPSMIYLHPWELDPNPPQVEGLSPVQWFRTYGSTDIFAYKLNRLLSDFRFVTIGEYIDERTRVSTGVEPS